MMVWKELNSLLLNEVPSSYATFQRIEPFYKRGKVLGTFNYKG